MSKKLASLNKYLIIVVMIATITSSCNAPNDEKKADAVYYCIKDGADYAAKSVESVFHEIEKEMVVDKSETLGYPEGYEPNNPIANEEFTEEDWEAIQKEEAMNSFQEDAMRAQYEEQYPEDHFGFPF